MNHNKTIKMKADEFYKEHMEFGFFELMESYASAKAEEVAVEFAAYLNDQNVLVNKEAAKDCYDEWFAQYKQSQ